MLKNRVALAHKRPRVHFLETSEKNLTRISLARAARRGTYIFGLAGCLKRLIWSRTMRKAYLVKKKPYLVKKKPYLVIKSSEFLPTSRPLWEKPYLVMKFCV